MAILGFEIEEIIRLLKMLEESGLEEVYLQEGGRSVRIRGPRRSKKSRQTISPASNGKVSPPVLSLPPGPRKDRGEFVPSEDQIVLKSPMVGMFYRAEKPGAPPLVGVGQHVSVGQAVGIIEAMKIFSEIPAEQAGIVEAVLVQDGDMVQVDAPLIVLRRE